jgi:hypothetical protein
MDPRHNISATEKPLELPIVLTIRKEGGKQHGGGKHQSKELCVPFLALLPEDVSSRSQLESGRHRGQEQLPASSTEVEQRTLHDEPLVSLGPKPGKIPAASGSNILLLVEWRARTVRQKATLNIRQITRNSHTKLHIYRATGRQTKSRKFHRTKAVKEHGDHGGST